jgi:hypothetical protein
VGKKGDWPKYRRGNVGMTNTTEEVIVAEKACDFERHSIELLWKLC